MARKYWTDQENPDKLAMSAGWRLFVIIVAFIAVVGILTAVVWGVKVAFSETKGAGDQTRIVNDATNRINAQQWFYSQHAELLSSDARLDAAYNDMQATIGTPDATVFRVSYSGLQKHCIDVRTAYNAETKKVTRAKWRDASLPFEIDSADPATDCQPSAAALRSAAPAAPSAGVR